jgi:hypothetical protein
MEKHTPGPWDFIDSKKLLHIETAIDNSSGAGIHICSVPKSDRANARLIAVSPDLLEACELMYEAWKQLLPCLGNNSVRDYELVLTTAPVACARAISRARG